jgi:chromate transporter
MAIHIGHRRAGWKGLLVAGTCFILPAALLTLCFAWLYVRFGRLPQATATLYGIKPVIVIVVVQALWGLGRSAIKGKGLAALAVASAVANAFGSNELIVLLAGGSLAVLAARSDLRRSSGTSRAFFVALLGSAPAAATVATQAVSSAGILLAFLKIGSVLFGSGYVLLAFLHADLVEQRRWLTEGQLLDAIAVGQVTPGPLFTTATFVGYLLHGSAGAVAATVGIFAPAFFFVALSAPIVPRLRRSRRAARFLDGLNVASLGLMTVVTWILARTALVDAWTVVLSLASAALLLRFKVNPAWLVLGGGLVGNLLHAIG